MSELRNRLKKVEYSRAYHAECEVNIQLIGDSRWIRDIELFLEETWKNIKCFPDAAGAKNGIDSDLPRFVLIEPSAYGEDTFRWVEGAIQNDIKALVIAPENHNQFEWFSISRRAAGLDVGAVMLSQDAQNAAKELGEILHSSDVLKTNRWTSDIRTIKAAHLGYKFATTDVGEQLESSLFGLLCDEFAFSSDHLAMATVLLETLSLWRMPKETGSELQLCYARVERELADTDLIKIVNAVQNVLSVFQSGELTDEKWSEILKNVGFGLLVRRKLASKYSNVVNLLNLGSGIRTLKIA